MTSRALAYVVMVSAILLELGILYRIRGYGQQPLYVRFPIDMMIGIVNGWYIFPIVYRWIETNRR